MHVRGDKAAEQSVSNALATLKKAGQLTQEVKTYKVREGSVSGWVWFMNHSLPFPIRQGGCRSCSCRC